MPRKSVKQMFTLSRSAVLNWRGWWKRQSSAVRIDAGQSAGFDLASQLLRLVRRRRLAGRMALVLVDGSRLPVPAGAAVAFDRNAGTIALRTPESLTEIPVSRLMAVEVRGVKRTRRPTN